MKLTYYLLVSFLFLSLVIKRKFRSIKISVRILIERNFHLLTVNNFMLGKFGYKL